MHETIFFSVCDLINIYKSKKLSPVENLKNTIDGQEFLTEGVSEKGGILDYVVLKDFKNSIFTEIALLIGVVHICLAFLRVGFRNFAGIGWVLAIIGGYLYFPSFLAIFVEVRDACL